MGQHAIVSRSRVIALLTAALLVGPHAAVAQTDKLAQGREALAKRLIALSQQTTFSPQTAAEMLGAKLSAGQRSTDVRTDYELGTTALIASGEASTANKWVYVSIKPASSLKLRFRHLEPMLLDLPHTVAIQTAHDENGTPFVSAKEHLFRVPAGMLVVTVPAGSRAGTYKGQLEKAYGDEWDAAAGKQKADEPVESVLLTNQPRRGLEKATTLRTFRERASKAPSR